MANYDSRGNYNRLLCLRYRGGELLRLACVFRVWHPMQDSYLDFCKGLHLADNLGSETLHLFELWTALQEK